MRIGVLLACIALPSAILLACSSDGSSVAMPRGLTGLNGGGYPGASAPADQDAASEAQSPDAGETARSAPDAGADMATPPPVAKPDAGSGDGGAVGPKPDGAAAPNVGGCACGCADGCLTELITGCAAPTGLLVPVCPKVPATCACNANCAGTPVEPPLPQCIAQFLITGG